jgi:hypothetical protein
VPIVASDPVIYTVTAIGRRGQDTATVVIIVDCEPTYTTRDMTFTSCSDVVCMHLRHYKSLTFYSNICDLRGTTIFTTSTTILGYSNICDLRGTTIFTTSTTILGYSNIWTVNQLIPHAI